MGTKHDAAGTGTGTNTNVNRDAITGMHPGTVQGANKGSGRGARADEAAPGAKRSWRTVLTVVLGAIATLVAALATLIAAVSARVTYYLPPPDGSTEATEHHDWIGSVLALIPVSLLGGLLALVTTVLGIGALVRRREAAPWQLVLAGLALILALAVLVAVPFLMNGIGTY